MSCLTPSYGDSLIEFSISGSINAGKKLYFSFDSNCNTSFFEVESSVFNLEDFAQQIVDRLMLENLSDSTFFACYETLPDNSILIRAVWQADGPTAFIQKGKRYYICTDEDELEITRENGSNVEYIKTDVANCSMAYSYVEFTVDQVEPNASFGFSNFVNTSSFILHTTDVNKATRLIAHFLALKFPNAMVNFNYDLVPNKIIVFFQDEEYIQCGENFYSKLYTYNLIDNGYTSGPELIKFTFTPSQKVTCCNFETGNRPCCFKTEHLLKYGYA